MGSQNQYTSPLETQTVTIANTASLSSGSVYLGGLRLFGIVMPAAFTGTILTFQMSHDGTTWSNVYDSTGAEYALTVGTSRYVAVDLTLFAPLQFIKVRSGTSGSPSVQGADITLRLLLRSV